MAEVIIGDNESFEGALKRFNKRVQQDGILAEARRREHYEKPSVKKKKKEAARLHNIGVAHEAMAYRHPPHSREHNQALETAADSGVLDYNGDMAADGTPADTDGDTVRDYRDLDSDNDGLSDLLEGDYPGADANDNGVSDGPDTDGDGITNSLDMKVGFGTMGAGLSEDDDIDLIEDYRDLDSDSDGIYDIIESKNYRLDANVNGVIDATSDRDSDGIRDVADDSDLDGTPDSEDNDPASFGG